MGVKNGEIGDSMILVSSSLRGNASLVRPGATMPWRPSTDSRTEYIQVSFSFMNTSKSHVMLVMVLLLLFSSIFWILEKSLGSKSMGIRWTKETEWPASKLSKSISPSHFILVLPSLFQHSLYALLLTSFKSRVSADEKLWNTVTDESGQEEVNTLLFYLSFWRNQSWFTKCSFSRSWDRWTREASFLIGLWERGTFGSFHSPGKVNTFSCKSRSWAAISPIVSLLRHPFIYWCLLQFYKFSSLYYHREGDCTNAQAGNGASFLMSCLSRVT